MTTLALALLLAISPCLPAAAQPPPSAPSASAGHDATVLLFHPVDKDEVDPFGVPFEGADAFSVRYQALTAQTGQFDYPVFVADGVRAIQALPNATRPYQGTVEAYEAAFAARQAAAVPLALTLRATVAEGQARLQVHAEPDAPIQESQGQRLHLRIALAEDPVHYQPPAPVSNGIVDHRFTVRAYHDAGPIALTAAANRTVSIPLDPSWRIEHLLAAAWVQADGTPGRFAPTEVLQSTHASLDGATVHQSGKGVLVEVYSATWCTPCLYGDLAAEQVALRHAGAQELASPSTRYLEAPSHPLLAVLLAAAVGLAVAFLPRGGKHL
ncbi:MAG TPA: hypothetical protein VM286_03400 [Candidatus Thermoplasmatota archaeon]|nr:hypothetical protein [Candidatus Thermoplasmatota archaeon]